MIATILLHGTYEMNYAGIEERHSEWDAEFMTIFTKIIDREIPADIVYEDDLCLAFRDINAQAPTHVLLIPKHPIPSLDDLTATHQEVAAHLMLKVREVAAQLGLDNGYRIVVNCGEDGGQSVDHLHIHLLGGRKLTWPPG